MFGRYRNSFAEINLQALEQNLTVIQGKRAGSAGLIPMVKADAYGHGDVHISKVCEKFGAQYLGVALIEEGIKLRLAGIQMPILVFGFFDSVGADALIKYRLTPVLSDIEQFEYLKISLHDGASFPVHIKFNTGMQRLGFEINQVEEVLKQFEESHYVKLEGVCTHFASSQSMQEQEELFQGVLKKIKKLSNANFVSHIASTTAIFSGLKNNYDLIRPGISIYGYGAPELIPVLSLKSNVSLVRNLKKGQVVSYGGTWKAAEDTKLAVIPMGYADGIPRALSNKGFVLINGERCPIRGIVCMDYFMVEVAHLKQQALVGDEVILIGQQKNEEIKADEIAQLCGTISYEILTGIQNRVPRVYVHS